MERQSKRHKHTQNQDSESPLMNVNEVQTILSIQELDDALFSNFRHLPNRTTSLIDFVEDTFDELRRSLFTIEEIVDSAFEEELEAENDAVPRRQPFIHFIDDPDYYTIGELKGDESTPSYTWDWTTNKMVEKK